MGNNSLYDTLKRAYDAKLKERWGEAVVIDVIESDFLFCENNGNKGSEHEKVSKVIRRNLYIKGIEKLDIEDFKLFPDHSLLPIVFNEVFRLPTLRENAFQELLINRNLHQNRKHLFVLVHGFKGCSMDMRLFKNCLNEKFENLLFLLSNSNEDNTENCIRDMGENLAKEVKGYLNSSRGFDVNQISFIGHSMGGLIIRAALPLLLDYKNKFNIFMTFSSPHLGYMYNSSKIIDAGIWFLNKMNYSLSIRQLSMKDDTDIENCMLYKLSKFSVFTLNQGLEYFEKIVFLSSYQDSYVPFESARIQTCNSNHQNKKLVFYQKMASNILRKTKNNQVFRIDVNFEIPERTIDNFIGRTAHIKFLESLPLMRILTNTLDDIFNN